MASLILSSFPRGPRLPLRLELSGAGSFYRRPTRFSIDWYDARGDLLLHVSARPDEASVVLTSFLDGEWGESIVVEPYPFSLDPHEPFRLEFEVTEELFRIAVDGRPLAEFPHRRQPSEIRGVCSSIFLWRLGEAGVAYGPSGEMHAYPWEERWVVAEDNPRWKRRRAPFRLFTILSTWMEEDVVEATVANSFRQGCERVYLVDNDSPDETVARAVAAGATLARTFSSEHYDEAARIELMQEVVDEISDAEGDEHIWWLWVDADEFHHGPRGRTLHEYLSTLDSRFRVVGARFFNHLPDERSVYVEGRHPSDSQPLCYEVPVPNCALGHSNHPLQRWDRDGPRLRSDLGAHTARSEALMLEPTLPVYFHHFPYRGEEYTRLRLARLFGHDGGGDRTVVEKTATDHMLIRLQALDAVYRGQLDEAVFFPPCVPGFTPELRRFEDWVGSRDAEIGRWY